MNDSSTVVLVVSFAADQACAASLAMSAAAGIVNGIGARTTKTIIDARIIHRRAAMPLTV
jgi:hypothetical protein